MAQPEKSRRPATGRARSAPPPPPKKGNPALLYGGIGGGALLLIILVAAMSSGNEPPPRPKPKPQAEAPAEPSFTRPVKPETGSILFNCTNSPKHEDEEVVVALCPCGARKKFYADRAADGYRCLSCTKVYDNAQIKCPKCGRVAVKTHLKPAFN